MKNEDIVQEITSMRGDGYRVAKSIFRLSTKPAGVFQMIGASGTEHQRPMIQAEAKRIVDAARERITLVDSGD